MLHFILALADDPAIPAIGIKVPELVRYLTTWLMALVPLVGGLMVAYHAVMKSVGTDEHQAAVHGRAIKTVLTNTAVALAATTIIKFVEYWVIMSAA